MLNFRFLIINSYFGKNSNLVTTNILVIRKKYFDTYSGRFLSYGGGFKFLEELTLKHANLNYGIEALLGTGGSNANKPQHIRVFNIPYNGEHYSIGYQIIFSYPDNIILYKGIVVKYVMSFHRNRVYYD